MALKTKSQLAEEIHDNILKKAVIEEIDATLLDQRMKTYKHGSKEKIQGIATQKMHKDNAIENEKLLLLIKRKITAYKAEEARKA